MIEAFVLFIGQYIADLSEQFNSAYSDSRRKFIENSFRSKTQAFMSRVARILDESGLGIQIALALFFLFTLAVKHAIIMVAFVGVSHPQRLLGSPIRL